MSKMSELSQVLDDLICCGEQLIRTANAMKECFTEAAESTVKPKKEAKASEPEVRSYSKEEVRALLAAKAKEAGGQFKAQVKAILISLHQLPTGGSHVHPRQSSARRSRTKLLPMPGRVPTPMSCVSTKCFGH